jgi:hypothetical protein
VAAAEPADEADRGRHPGFARHEDLAGGPGSLSLSFAGKILGGRMTNADWLTATDPARMISWLDEQGYRDQLWDYTVSCCRRALPELPGDVFRRVIDHVENIGIRDVEDVLHEVWKALDKMEKRLRKAGDSGEEDKINRQIGFGRMLLAFDYQSVDEMADSISGDLIEWATDQAEERQRQSDVLRQLVPDPSQAVDQEEEEDEEAEDATGAGSS